MAHGTFVLLCGAAVAWLDTGDAIYDPRLCKHGFLADMCFRMFVCVVPVVVAMADYRITPNSWSNTTAAIVIAMCLTYIVGLAGLTNVSWMLVASSLGQATDSPLWHVLGFWIVFGFMGLGSSAFNVTYTVSKSLSSFEFDKAKSLAAIYVFAYAVMGNVGIWYFGFWYNGNPEDLVFGTHCNSANQSIPVLCIYTTNVFISIATFGTLVTFLG